MVQFVCVFLLWKFLKQNAEIQGWNLAGHILPPFISKQAFHNK